MLFSLQAPEQVEISVEADFETLPEEHGASLFSTFLAIYLAKPLVHQPDVLQGGGNIDLLRQSDRSEIGVLQIEGRKDSEAARSRSV